jgi:hypothetical protein
MLSSGGNTYDPGVGSDNYSSVVFEAETSGYRTSTDWFAISGWVESFKELLNMESRISIDDNSDHESVNWDDEDSEDYWGQLKEGDED